MATTTVKTSKTSSTESNPMLPDIFVVDKAYKNTKDTFTIELIPQKKSDGFTFEPGQFNMLYTYGVGEVPISISSDPSDAPRLIHTIRAVGAVTRAMMKLKKGAQIAVRGPYGASWPVEIAKGHDVILLAGGIGLAPLRPALYHILNNREKYGKVIILYGTRTPKDILYRKELEHWRSRLDLYVDVTVDSSAKDWHGNVEVVTRLIPRANFDPLDCIAMICGPEIMMRYGALALMKQGVSQDNIYVSMERNMKCGVGLCGHCQFGDSFICKDGPVYSYSEIKDMMLIREL